MYIHMLLTPGWELLSRTGLFCVTLRTGREFFLPVIVSRSQLQAVSSFLMLFLHPNLNFSANSLREDYKFHHTFSNEIAKLLKASPGKLVVMQPEKFQSKHEPKMHVLNLKVGSWSRAKMFVFGIEGSLSLYLWSAGIFLLEVLPLDIWVNLFVHWNCIALFKRTLWN